MSSAAAATGDRFPLAATRARSRAYGLLARALRYPDRELFEALRGGTWQAALAGAARASGLGPEHPFLDELRRLPASLPETLAGLQGEHTALFAAGAACPSQESEYVAANAFQKADVMADVAGFYSAFGLRVSRERGELPDFLGCELEFLHLITRKTAFAQRQGRPEAAAVCRDAHEKFLAEHLGAWVGSYRERVERSRVGPIYTLLARLIDIYVRAPGGG